MDNHLHVLLRLDPDVATGWSDEEIARSWGRLVPPRDRSRRPLPVTEDCVQEQLRDSSRVAEMRERLQGISWFMTHAKGCLMASRWVATLDWSITPAGSSAMERRLSRPSFTGFKRRSPLGVA
jgi:hypothetical protein